MSTTIPDLWSDDIRVDVVTPAVILRAQQDLLGRKTQGILEAKVTTASTDTWVQLQLDLIAPALNQYRLTLLTAKHQENMVYPVTVRAQCFAPKPKPTSLGGIVTMATSMSAVVAAIQGEPPPDQREAATQEEFIELVRQVLHSDNVRAVIQSLIAKSNEIQSADPSAEQDQPDTNAVPPTKSVEGISVEE